MNHKTTQKKLDVNNKIKYTDKNEAKQFTQ